MPYLGVDVSKDTLTLAKRQDDGSFLTLELPNREEGFLELLARFPGHHVVMEVSGPYGFPLAYFLHGHGMKVSMVNPRAVHHFHRAQLRRAKTDRVDARVIVAFAEAFQPEPWHPASRSDEKLRMRLQALRLLQRQIRALENALKAMEVYPVQDEEALEELRKLLEELKAKARKLEASLECMMEALYHEELRRLRTIPGIGPKTARFLLLLYRRSRKEGARSWASYLGLVPLVSQSGRSLHSSRLSKWGSPEARRLLFLSAMAAVRHAPELRQWYEARLQRGKPRKVVLMALAHKLARIAFAVLHRGGVYQAELV